MRAVALLIIALATSSGISWAQPGQDGGADRADGRSRYDVLFERNIFLRERRRTAEPPPQPVRPAAPPRTPEQRYMLTGIVFEDGAFRAYFESADGGPTTRVAVGDLIARGQVAEIMIDAVAYVGADDAALTWVEIGQDLTGAAPSASDSRSSWAGSGSPRTGSADGGSDDGDDGDDGNDDGNDRRGNGNAAGESSGGGMSEIERRLRERRLQEMNHD